MSKFGKLARTLFVVNISVINWYNYNDNKNMLWILALVNFSFRDRVQHSG